MKFIFIRLLTLLTLSLLIFGIHGCSPVADDNSNNGNGPGNGGTEPGPFDAWAGSAACASCHATKYNTWKSSGHASALKKVENGQKPGGYPETSLPDFPPGLQNVNNSAGIPSSWADISYVIGGFRWKAQFTDKNGYLFTGTDTSYHFASQGWGAYKAGQSDMPFDCGKCHAAGWQTVDQSGSRQDELPGMDGIFFEAGVSCESCHGAGKNHVDSGGGKGNITVNRDASLCGNCHSRNSDNRISSMDGLVRDKAQFDELKGVDPDSLASLGKHLAGGIGCNDCHDPHDGTDKSVRFAAAVDCTDCHQDRIIKPEKWGRTHADLACTYCHMPAFVKSAVEYSGTGTGYKRGDMRSHIFKIDLQKTDKQQFTNDGNHAYPWLTGKVVCGQCHNGETTFKFVKPFGPDWTFQVHN